TNKSDNLTKWTFPDVTVAPNGYLVVFASNKNTVMANGEIHTNFKLSAGGDYLALVDPSGTKVSEFDFPAQENDVSYGVYENTEDTTVVNVGNTAYLKVPTNGSAEAAGYEWYRLDPSFDTTSWTQGQTGVGYEIPLTMPAPATQTFTPSTYTVGSSTYYYGPYGTGGSYNLYQVVTGTTTWINAYNTAKTMTQNGVTGHLVAITSAAENTFVKGLITATSWIGLTDSTSATFSGLGTHEYGNTSTWTLPADGVEPTPTQRGAGFKWITGEPFTYQSWVSGQPNNSGEQDGVQLATDGTWNDQPNGEPGQSATTLTSYVVEYDIGTSFAYGPYGPNGTWNLYQMVSSTGTWLDAYNAAQGMTQRGVTGHLVAVDTAAENTFIKGLYNGAIGWLGLTDSTSATFSALGTQEYGNTSASALPAAGSQPTPDQRGAGFKWVSGDPFTYQNWSGGQPDDGAGAGTQDGVEMLADGSWADNKNGEAGQTGVTRSRYIVEYDIGDDLGGQFVYGPYGANGTWDLYQVVNISGTWLSAYNAAKTMTYAGKTGHLVSITSAAENSFVQNLLTTGSWIGLADSATYATGALEGGNTSALPLPTDGTAPVSGQRGYGFKWVTAENATYQNWANGSPDDGNGTGTQDGAAMAIDGSWTDEKNGEAGQTGVTRSSYVVEYDIGDRFVFGPYGPNGTWNLYQLSSSTATWLNAYNTAKATAQGGQTGHLVSIGSSAENAFIKSLIGADTWIGLTDSETFGGTEKGNTSALTLPAAGQVPSAGQRGEGFVWVSGDPFTYQNWNSGQPDDSGGLQDAGYITTGGTWYDEKDGETGQTGVSKLYVTEYELHLSAIGGSFTVTTARTTATILNLTTALQILLNPAAGTSSVPFINYADPENSAAGRFVANIAFPNNTTADDNNFVVRATGIVKIPTSGTYTFGVKSDDGFRLKIDGADFATPTLISGTAGSITVYSNTGTNKNILEHATTGASEGLAATYLTAGEHLIELTYFEVSSTSGVELYAAPGTRTAWDANLFRLVGDTLSGGLPLKGIKDSVVTDISAALRGENTTAYIRIPFTVEDTAVVDRLVLRLKYADGFVAYINGVEVARANAPATLTYDSAATASQPYEAALQYATFDISNYRNLLVTGDQNVLAIRLLNSPTVGGYGDLTSLIDPQLLTGRLLDPPETLRYFPTPTPGLPNITRPTRVGDTKFSVDRGYFDAPFDVEITTDTPGAQIRYTTNGSDPTDSTGTLYTGPVHITTTTTLKAVAFKDGWDTTEPDCQTYIFLDDVLTQTGAGFPTLWIKSDGTPFYYPADYAMDDTVVNDPRYAELLREDLKSIPTLSVVASVDDLFGPNGIYPNALQGGPLWERPSSVEFIDPSGGDEFQINAGIQIYGGVVRDPRFPKHSFRVVFKDMYGPTKLDFPLFLDGDAVESFDSVVLRSEFNNSWPYGNNDYNQVARGIMARDQWMRASMEALGDPTSHIRYVNLYLNGLYWGVYSITERPDESFQSSYFGGTDADYDVVHDTSGNNPVMLSGDAANWNAMMAEADSADSADLKFQKLNDTYVNMTEYIDYMILNIYGSNNDWDDHNWYAARPRTADGKWQFFIWDGERTLEGPAENKTGINTPFRPSRLYGMLKTSTEFKMLFADRLQKAFFDDGALTPAN
ncbi:MAG: lectin-like protein, partial [Planctomycetota bacterium]|nr:lectin-like protein [Planctomycetota bacterium]